MRRLLILLVALLIAPLARAASVSVEPKQPAAYVGQTLTLVYSLSGAESPADPPALAIDGCVVKYAGMGQQSFTQIVNGRYTAQETYQYRYNVQAIRPGRFIAPELVFDVPGEGRVVAPSVAIVSANAPESPDFSLSLDADTSEAYVGQPVTLTWEFEASRDVTGLDIAWPAPEGADIAAGPASDPDRIGRQNVVQMMGVSAALRGERRRDSVVYTAQLIVVPSRPGELLIPDARLLIEADTGRRRRGVSIFDSRAITETFSAGGEGPTIMVRDLPESGRPGGFTGLVGRYRMEATASPTSVRVGDPIDLTVSVYGPEGAPVEPEIDLTNAPGFSENFRVDSEDQTARSGGRLFLKRTLRAQRDDVRAIPPIELPYFDPELDRYAVARTQPIPLEVSPTRVVTLADAQGDRSEAVQGEALESRAGGLRANVTAPSALANERFDIATFFASPLGAAAVVAPPAMCAIAGVAGFVRKRRDADKDRRASRRALPAALASLKSASDADDVAAAIRAYLTTRFREAGSVTPGDVTRLLGDENSYAREISAVLGECDAARFGGSATDPDELAQRAASALHRLEKGGLA